MANGSVEGQRRSRSEGFRLVLKGFLPGVGLIVLGFAMMFAVLYWVPFGQPSEFLFFSSVGIICVGVFVLAALGYVVITRVFEGGLVVPPGIVESLRQIELERVFEAERFLVFEKNGIYVLLPKELFIGAYFVRLFRHAKVSAKGKVKLPFRRATGIIRKGRFQDEVNGLSIAKFEGAFTAPVSAVKLGERDFGERYVRGPGVLYFVFRYDLKSVATYRGGCIGIDRLMSMEYNHPHYDLSDKFDKATILKIIEKLSKEELKS